MPLKPLIVGDVYADLAGYFRGVNDPDAVFGGHAKVGAPRVDEGVVTFIVSGNDNAVRITIAPHGENERDDVACPECGRGLDHQHSLSERKTCMRALRARQLGIVTDGAS